MGHQPIGGSLVGQTPKYLNQAHAGQGLNSLNYNSNNSASNGSLSLLPQDPHLGGKLFLPQNVVVDSRSIVAGARESA